MMAATSAAAAAAATISEEEKVEWREHFAEVRLALTCAYYHFKHLVNQIVPRDMSALPTELFNRRK